MGSGSRRGRRCETAQAAAGRARFYGSGLNPYLIRVFVGPADDKEEEKEEQEEEEEEEGASGNMAGSGAGAATHFQYRGAGGGRGLRVVEYERRRELHDGQRGKPSSERLPAFNRRLRLVKSVAAAG